jgi:alpha-tubulin suppressor-like RCC1 family protein
MDDRDDRGQRRSPLRLVLAALLASVAGAAPACLPSVSFDGNPSDSGPPFADATQPDGGADARGDALVDSAPPGDADADVETAPPRVPMSGSPAFIYDATGACIVHLGQLECWGDPGMNSWYELGFSSDDAGGALGIPNPTPVTTTAFPASQIVQIVMGTYHSCALYGTAPYCWGNDQSGQLGSSMPNAGGPTEVAVDGLPTRGLSSMATGVVTTCGITPAQDGGGAESNVFCWGSNGSGELGRPLSQTQQPTAFPVTGEIDGGPLGVIPNAVAIAGGAKHFCVLTSTSKVFCWGSTSSLESGADAGMLDCTEDETIACSPQPNEVTMPTGETPIGLALGDNHSCAVMQSGNVYCWGANDVNQLGTTSSMQTCPGDGDAGIPCTGVPAKASVSNIQKLFAAGSTTCALDTMRHAWCWGDNQFGVLATGDLEPYTSPQEIVDPSTLNPSTFDDMAMGSYSACALDGQDLYCWGRGALGTQPLDGGAAPSPFSPGLVQF